MIDTNLQAFASENRRQSKATLVLHCCTQWATSPQLRSDWRLGGSLAMQ